MSFKWKWSALIAAALIKRVHSCELIAIRRRITPSHFAMSNLTPAFSAPSLPVPRLHISISKPSTSFPRHHSPLHHARLRNARIPIHAQTSSSSNKVSQIVRDAQTVYSRSKPWWCQPWSIISTGMILIAAPWTIVSKGWFGLPAVFLALIMSAGVSGWWFVFLVLYPQSELTQDNDVS